MGVGGIIGGISGGIDAAIQGKRFWDGADKQDVVSNGKKILDAKEYHARYTSESVRKSAHTPLEPAGDGTVLTFRPEDYGLKEITGINAPPDIGATGTIKDGVATETYNVGIPPKTSVGIEGWRYPDYGWKSLFRYSDNHRSPIFWFLFKK